MAGISIKKQRLEMRSCVEEELYNDIAKASDLLRKLNEDRLTTEIFTDANLEKDGCKFPVNKCILSVYSDMFKDFFLKNDAKVMQLQQGNPKTIAALLEFIYSGDLSVAEENVKDLLAGAIYFKIPFVEKHCRMYMKEKNIGKQELSANRCIKKASKYFKNDHSWEILDKLNRNRFCNQSQFCDVSIVCEGEVFRVHKSVICAFSSYFEKLFTTEMREKAEGTVTLKNVSAQTMQTILNFMYTGNIIIREDNVYDILECAEYLQMLSIKGFDFNILERVEYLQTSIKDYCSCFLSSHLTLQNFFTVYSYAQAYKVTAALRKASLFFFENLEMIAKQEDFFMVSFGVLYELLQVNERESSCEETVYKSVMSWIKHKIQRKNSLPKLIQHIKFEKLSHEFLKDFVLVEEIQTDSTACMQHLITGILEHVPAEKQNRILIFGQTHEKLGTPERRVYTYDVKNGLFYVTNPIAKDYPNCGEIAELNSEVYLIGGYNSNAVIRANIHEPNPKSHKVKSMLEKREHPRAATLNGCIYVTGGHSDENVPTSSCERYDAPLDKWFSFPSMNRPRAHHGLVELNGLLYAVGGYSFDMDDPLNSVECFDPSTGRWRMVASLSCARHGAAVVTFNGEIFVIGGCNQETYLTCVEKYSPQTDSWSGVAPVVDARNLAAACVVNNKIFIIGGENEGDVVLSIEAYHPAINEWKKEAILPSCYELCIGPGRAVVL